MIQSIIVALFFIGAAGYLGWMVYQAFMAQSCSTGCGKCNVIDFHKIEKALAEKETSLH